MLAIPERIAKILPITWLLLPSIAWASTVVALSEQDLTERADTIVVGTVVQNEVHLTPHGNVSTRVEVEVQRAVRGAREGDVLNVEVPGGKWRGLTHMAEGSPQLLPGQLVVLFLETHGNIKRPIGLSLGVYRVGDGHPGWLVDRDLRGLSLVGNGTVNRTPELLETFLQRIDARVRALNEAGR